MRRLEKSQEARLQEVVEGSGMDSGDRQTPQFQISGVDYRLLGERLSQRNLTVAENNWAMDLAMTHAFVEST